MRGLGRVWRELPGTVLLVVLVLAAVGAVALLPGHASAGLFTTLRWLWLPVYILVALGIGRNRDHELLLTDPLRKGLMLVGLVLILGFCGMAAAATMEAVSPGTRGYAMAAAACSLGSAAVLKLADTRRRPRA